MSKKTKVLTKFLSVFLSVLTIVSVIPLHAFAEDITYDNSEETAETVSAEDEFEAQGEAEILSEDEAKREEYTKHFRMSDGTMQAVQYETPIHFENNGKWEDYDNTLKEIDATEEENEGELFKNKDLINTFADFSVRFSKRTNGKKFVRFEKDGYDISWYYKDANKKRAKVLRPEDDDDKTTLENITSEVIYKNVYKDTDFQYFVNSEGVKENILLTDDNAPTEFVAEYKANGLTPIQIDSKTIELQDKDGKVIYILSAPYMVDSDFEVSYDVSLTLGEIKNGKFTVTTTLNSEWVKSKDRVYPITVDPLLESSQKWDDNTSCHSAYIASSTPNAKYGRGGADYEGSIYVGSTLNRGKTRGLVKNPTLPKLGVADKVVHAEMAMYVHACYPELIINLHRVTSAWDQKTVCWNSNVQYDPAIVDYQTVQYMEIDTPNKTRWQRFEITELAKGWYDGTYANNGILLRSDKETSTSQARAWLFSSGYTTDSAARPILLVQYRNMTGYEDHWSFTNVSAGRGGVASVNNYNGNLVFSQPVTEDAGGNLMPVNISFVFNANGINAPYSYMACNMKTNYHIYLTKETNAGLIENGYKYYLTDADGTKHWFKFESGKTTGKDEDGLGLTLDEIAVGSDSNEKNAKFRITDKDKTKMYFNSDGRITKILNAAGVSSIVEYETYESTVRIKCIKDGANRAYNFLYHELYPYLLVAVQDPAGRKTDIQYNTGYLTYLTFPDNKGFGFTYDRNNGTLTEIRSIDGTKTNITYDGTSQKRVKNIKWGTADSSLESYTFAYRQNETTVTDIQNRSYTYQFNDWGQTTGIVSNTDGTAQFFAYNQGNSTDSRANKLVSESKVLKSVTNYVVNPGFSNNFTSYWTYIQNTSGAIVTTESGKSNLTKNALKVEKPSSNTGRVNAVQTINNLPGGTYTLSGYINTNGATLGGDGAAIFAEVRQPVDGAVVSSNLIEKTTKTNGWERRSVTFTVPDNGTVRVTMGLNGNAYGTVWFDDLQLEKSEGMSSYNLVENPGITNGLTKWSSKAIVTNVTDLPGYSKSISKTGTPTEQWLGLNQYIQTIPGKKGDVFSAGAWIKADSAPVDNDAKADDKYIPRFSLAVHFCDSANKVLKTEEIKLNPDVTTWQFASGKIVAPVDYDRLCFEVIYYSNVNNVYMTGAFCYKEEFGQTYTYDKNGNVVSAVDLAKTNSTFSYCGNQMAKMLNPSGSKYLYNYDDKNQLTYAFSSDGQQYGFTYDDKGNATKAEITARKPVTAIESGKVYTLVNAYSGLAIDSGKSGTVGSTTTTYRNFPFSKHQQWQITLVPGTTDVYTVKSTAFDNRYLDVTGNVDVHGTVFEIYVANTSNAQKFKFVKQSDGTFGILTASSNYKKCADGQLHTGTEIFQSQPLKQANCDVNNLSEGQKWYIYPAATTEDKTIVTETEYTASKNFVSSSTDQRGNKTNYSYDESKGLLNSVTDANNNKTEYKYDPNTNSLQSVTSGGMTNSYSYANDRLTDINVNGATHYKFNYDQFGRTTSTQVGNGTNYRTLSALEYNTRNLLAKQLYGNGNYVAFSYDNLDRITEKKYNNQRVTYSYGSDGAIARTTDYYTNTNTRFVYDLAGRVVSQREFNGTSLGGNQLKSYTNFTYADKTNYLTGVEHYSPLGTQNIGYRYGDLAKGEMPDQIYNVTWNGKEQVKYTYDGLGRLTNKSVNGLNNIYTYEDVNETKTTTLVKSVQTSSGTYTYTYDKLGNIVSINDGTYTISYGYDNLNQLVRVNNERIGKTYTYAYTNGNITERKEYAYTVSELSEVVDTKTWTYGDSTWADLLTNYNGTEITYDTIGNPLTIGNKTLTWNGRQLQQIVDEYNTISYAYNGDGQRVSKTVNGVTTEYFYNGEILAGQKTGNDKIVFMYDNNGDVFGFTYNGVNYYYVKNAQNDITAIADSNGKVIANYYYDSWGKLVEITGNTDIAELNPIRYRSYYYDSEAELYYLNTRYYSPELCRFISSDDTDVLDEDQDSMVEENLFSYCLNNPVNLADDDGTVAWWIAAAAAGAAWDAAFYCVGAVVKGNFSWKGLGKAALKGAVTGLAFGAVGKIASKAYKAVKVVRSAKRASNVRKTSKTCSALTKITKKSFCFVAGTEILTEHGLVSIEEIKEGDLVWAENPETGEKALKPVVQLFINETNELVNIYIGDEMVVATPGHPFYVEGKGWVDAICLKKGDKVPQKDGSYAKVKKVQYIYSEIPITVYNFEVADFHTYFVGEDSVLVHNKNCGMDNLRVLKDTKIKGYSISMDLERGGSGLTNIHIKVNNVKYYYRNGKFISNYNGQLPKSLRNNEKIQRALNKALDALNKGW